VALKKNNPGCNCCAVCGLCSDGTMPSVVSVTYPADLVMGSCNMSELAGNTFLLPYSATLDCLWDLVDLDTDLTPCAAGLVHQAEIVEAVGLYYRQITIVRGGSTYRWRDSTGSATPVDCSAAVNVPCDTHPFGDAVWSG
jgi:hypothetical protein